MPHGFWLWAAWKDACARARKAGIKPGDERYPPRPVGLRKRIPASWWARYAIHVGKLHPKPPVVIPPEIVPHVGLDALMQRVIFCAENPLAAIDAPPGTIIALTADPNPAYACYATASVVAAHRAAGHAVTDWGNQEQIGAERIESLHAQLGLDGLPIFQFETAAEADSMIAAQASLGVGNGNALRPQQIELLNRLIDQGLFACSQEAYTNLTGPYPEQTSAGGLKVCSLTIGVYDGSSEVAGGRYVGMPEYHDHTNPGDWRNICAYHAAGNRDGWALFPHP